MKRTHLKTPKAMPEQLELFLGPPPLPSPIQVDSRASPAVISAAIIPDAAELLQERLRGLLACPLGSLTLTNNRARIFSARPVPSGPAIDLRIHHSFVAAPESVLRAVADYLESGQGSALRRGALATIRQYFDGQSPSTPPLVSTRTLRPIGRTWDLRLLRDGLNRGYFDGVIDVDITWGRAAPRRRRRSRSGFSIRLGSYNAGDNLVRIHPHLDRPEVPEYVVESVVHHEMLHAALPPVMKNGRRCLHTPEFRRRECLYQRHEDAETWLAEHLPRLAGCG